VVVGKRAKDERGKRARAKDDALLRKEGGATHRHVSCEISGSVGAARCIHSNAVPVVTSAASEHRVKEEIVRAPRTTHCSAWWMPWSDK